MILIALFFMMMGIFAVFEAAIPNHTPPTNKVHAEALAASFVHFETAVIRCAETEKSKTACVTNAHWKKYLPSYMTPPAATITWAPVNGGQGARLEGYFNQPAPPEAATYLARESAPEGLPINYAPYGLGQGARDKSLRSAPQGVLYNCCYAQGRLYFVITLSHF